MRVSLININLVGSDATGNAILNQIRYFQRRGDEVRVYVPTQPSAVGEEILAISQVVSLKELLARRDPHFAVSDLYIFHYPSYYELVESIHALDRGAILFYFHNVTPPELWNRPADQEHLRQSIGAVERLIRLADLIVTPSQFNAGQLIEQHHADPGLVRVLPLAVPLENFKPGARNLSLLSQYHLEGTRVILSVGRMASNKRIERLIDALAMIKTRVPNVALLLVGDTSSNPGIVETVEQGKKLAATRGVADDVLFTGTVSARDLPDYYRLADVYATASLHEGFGVPPLEAMACGVPVVASRATAHPEVLGDAALYSEPDDAESLATQLLRLLNDDRLYGEFVQRGLAHCKRYSLENYLAGWTEIIAEVTAILPNRPFPFGKMPTLQTRRAAEAPQANDRLSSPRTPNSTLAADIEQLQHAADVMLPGYQVQSKLPIIGPLIAWLRRNLTSHLREPYLDLMFKRQESYNWMVVNALRHIAQQLSEKEPTSPIEQAVSQEQILELKAEIERLKKDLAQTRTGEQSTQ